MARVAPTVPEDSALLCEKCGYIINGIAAESACPECGAAVAESQPSLRGPPAWERGGSWHLAGFLSTSAAVIFVPTRFFRSITPRGDMQRSRAFAAWHQVLCSVIFGTAAYMHALWAWPNLRSSSRPTADDIRWAIILIILFTAVTYVTFTVVTALASRLTAWEAAYRGLRLPHAVVKRALHYHAAHYLPVALITLATIAGYQMLIRHDPMLEQHGVRYLVVLCVEVVVAAVYLFITYWKGMRNLMYANG